MPRSFIEQLPVDSGLFSPVGLQPASVFRLGFNAASGWLSRYAMSHRRLVKDRHVGFVIWSAQYVALEPSGFIDADCVEMHVRARIRGAATQLECEGELFVGPRPAARMLACCVPLALDGDDALSGIPAPLSPAVLASFLPEEIQARPQRSAVPSLQAAIASEGRRLRDAQMGFTIHRHQCELADQWFWPEAASLASASREDLIRGDGEAAGELAAGLAAPVQRLDLVFHRPFFLFDEGVVRSSAYAWRERLVFIHELAGPGEVDPRAIAIEQFDPLFDRRHGVAA